MTITTERPILFGAPMVRALLAGTKTQTRRVVKPVGNDGGFVLVERDDGVMWPHRSDDGESCFVTRRERDGEYLDGIAMSCPSGQPGDRLWVREALQSYGEPPHIQYVADCTPMPANASTGADARGAALWPWSKPKRVSIHMPRWASRITLEITGVRVERLQDISLQDVRAEGCEVRNFWLFGADATERQRIGANVFRDLWEQINPGSWEANPWVWVIGFKRVLRGAGTA